MGASRRSGANNTAKRTAEERERDDEEVASTPPTNNVTPFQRPLPVAPEQPRTGPEDRRARMLASLVDLERAFGHAGGDCQTFIGSNAAALSIEEWNRGYLLISKAHELAESIRSFRELVGSND